MRKKKLLFIKKNYSPYGGAELYLQNVIKHLIDSYDIHIISENWPLIPGATIYKTKKIKIFSDLFFTLNVKKFLKRNHQRFYRTISFDRCPYVDIFRASDGCHKKWLEQRKLFEKKAKTIANYISLKHKTTLWLEKKCLINCKKIIANSNMVKKEFKNYYGKEIPNLEKKITVCYNGIDLKNFYPIKESSKESLKKKFNIKISNLLLFVGSGYKRKGIDIIISNLERLPESTYIVVIGKDKKLKTYKEKYKKYQDIIFWGPEKNILPFYQMADIFILPTYYDPFANTTLEALACGVPVITSIYNGAHEIIEHGKEGFIIDVKEDINLNFYIAEILANKEFLKPSTKKVKQFDLNQVIKKFKEEIEA